MLREFNNYLQKCDIVVGHNISFDKRMIFVECLRNKIEQNFTLFKGKEKINKPEYCTMKNTKDFCNLQRLSSKNINYLKLTTVTPFLSL